MQAFIVREAVPDDAESVLEYLKELAVEPYNGVTFSSIDEVNYTLDEQRERIQMRLDSETEIMVVAIAEGKVVGISDCRTERRVFRHTASLGISVHKDWRRKGIGSALLQYILDWCKQHPQIKRTELSVFENNSRAIPMYEKFGFELEGRRKKAIFKDGQWLDVLQMGIVWDKEVDTNY